MISTSVVAIVATDDAQRSQTDIQRDQSLAEQLSLPLLDAADALPPECTAYLSYRADRYQQSRLQLFPADAKQSGPICVDFASDAAVYRLQSGGELVVKAVKGRSKNSLRVIDATAGLGRDSFVLAAHGFSITLIERNAVVAALLRDGLLRAAQSPVADIAARMQLVSGDAIEYFSKLPSDQRPEVIYLDPMFAHNNEKTALVKKDMRLFQQLLSNESSDEAQLLQQARANASLRVVVKRALKAPYLAANEPAYSLSGKAIRFDIYPS